MIGIRSLADLVPVALIEPDGLIVTTDGRYVRVLECTHVPNAVSADQAELRRVEVAYRELARSIPDGQQLTIVSQTDPLSDPLAADRDRVTHAGAQDEARGADGLARARRRLFAGLEQTVAWAAGAEQPAVGQRWWVIVSWQPRHIPGEPAGGTEQLRQAFARSRARTTWQAHLSGAVQSLRFADQAYSALAGAGIDVWPLDGPEVMAVLWQRLHPAATSVPDAGAFQSRCRLPAVADLALARQVRHDLLGALCAGYDAAPQAGIDTSQPGRLMHRDGTVEEVLHLGTPPLRTSPWWLSFLLACPLPATLAVHIRVGSRGREIARQRRRWRRLRAAITYKDRRDRLIGSDETDALQEAELVDQELSAEIGATIYEVGIYLAVRDPAGNARKFEAIVGETARAFHALTNARVIRGRRLNLPGFTATLPLGVDPLRATRSYAQRNIAHCIPLTSSRCGSPEGLVLGTADPGGTIERIDPFDPLYPRRVTLVIGPSGGGKTVLMNALLMRAISQGMRGWIIDRSSTPDDTGQTAGTGHYDTLLSLIPGARRVQVGSAHGDVICPWDVPDPTTVPAEKKEFLLALHALLIGHASGTGQERALTAVEEGLLSTGIDAVYRHAGQTGERPRETLLLNQLRARTNEGGLAGANADALQSLILRLEPLAAGGALAHLCDAPTTVPDDAPLTLFDLTGLPERLVPAMVLMLIAHITAQVQHTRRQRVDGDLDGEGVWAGKPFLVVEEGWAMTQSPAAGAWLNEWARRSRHYALWLLFITQHFKDIHNQQGRALLANSVLRLCLQNERDDLELGRDTIGLTDVDIEQITTLPMRTGEYATVYVTSPRGKGAVRVALGDLEYWIASSDPEHDQPRRHHALQESHGDPWQALRLLCSPEWQHAHSARPRG